MFRLADLYEFLRISRFQSLTDTDLEEYCNFMEQFLDEFELNQ